MVSVIGMIALLVNGVVLVESCSLERLSVHEKGCQNLVAGLASIIVACLVFFCCFIPSIVGFIITMKSRTETVIEVSFERYKM
jgi:UPF0716 family protein affecting phage T7 exclusion